MLYDPKALKAAASFASTDETRPALNGVCAEQSGRLLASDGHKGVFIESLNPQKIEDYPVGHELAPLTADTIIPLEAIKAATGSSLKMNKHLPILSQIVLGENGKPTLYRTNLDQSQAVPFRAIEGPFPNMDLVLPKTDPVFTIAVNAELTAEVLKALVPLTDFDHYVLLEFRTDKGAIIIRSATSEHKVTALLMPLQKNEEHK